MNKTGFIGFGAMGGIMIEALVRCNAIPADQVVIDTRTPAKLKPLLQKYPEIEAAGSIKELAGKCRRVFICTGTDAVKAVLEELVNYLQSDAHIVTITGIIEMKCIENIFHGAVTRIMPTQIAEIGEGVTLILHNDKVGAVERRFIQNTFAKIGRVKEITENQMDLAADLASCAPAFYAAVMKHITLAAEKFGGKFPWLPPAALSSC
jgi:pyrroline-5-carboxylate reductase